MKASVLALAFLCLAGCASAASDPTCANGLKASHAGETICCAASCGVCGGPRCATSPGGAAKCCPSAIKAAATSCKAAEAPCIVDGVSKQAVTLTTEQLQKYVLEMNKLDINGVITGQQAKSLTSLNDVILYSKTAPSWDIKRATKALYVPPARLPEIARRRVPMGRRLWQCSPSPRPTLGAEGRFSAVARGFARKVTRSK